MKPLLIILCLFLLSCQKKPDPYEIASKGDSVEWHFKTRAYTQVIIEGWGTAQCNGNQFQDYPTYKDSVYKMSAWNGNRNILGLSYIVWLYTDKTWVFVNNGIVQFHNDIINKKQ